MQVIVKFVSTVECFYAKYRIDRVVLELANWFCKSRNYFEFI